MKPFPKWTQGTNGELFNIVFIQIRVDKKSQKIVESEVILIQEINEGYHPSRHLC